MTTYRRLPQSQDDYGGRLACTMAACYVGRAVLEEMSHYSDLLSDAALSHIDAQIYAACESWRLHGQNHLLSVPDCLALDSDLGQRVAIVEEFPTRLAGDELDDARVIVRRGTEPVLQEWFKNPGDTVCVVIQAGFSFLLVPATENRSSCYVIDTHHRTVDTRQAAISRYAMQVGPPEGGGGMVLSSIWWSDLLRFVLDYSSIKVESAGDNFQVDLAVLRLKSQ